MITRIVQIGKSQGICIPQRLLERTGLRGEVEVHAEKDTLIIQPISKPRAGWAEACQKMIQPSEQELADEFPFTMTQFDEDGWEW